MSKGLEALKYLKENKRRHWIDGDKSTESLDVVEKELKVLEIIKNKKVLAGRVMFAKELWEYNNYVSYDMELTEEEWNLLREVLL